MKTRKEYCSTCGRELVYRKRGIHKYSTKTGEPIYEFEHICPAFSFWTAVLTQRWHTRKTIVRNRVTSELSGWVSQDGGLDG